MPRSAIAAGFARRIFFLCLTTSTLAACSSSVGITLAPGSSLRDEAVKPGAADSRFMPESKSFTTLYSFAGGADGANPYGGVIVDKSGDVFGSTAGGGGSAACGTLFQLTPSGGGYTETLAHAFTNGDGCGPNAGPIEDSSGNLYVTAPGGGQYNNGTVVKVHAAAGGYSETALYSFGSRADGIAPNAALLERGGTLYTTAYGGGRLSQGAIVELTASGLSESVAYSFKSHADGAQPFGNLVADTKGALYGTTTAGGPNNDGTVFRFVPGKGGSESVLWAFKGSPGDGAAPFAGVVVDAVGNIYGTTENGGTQNKGAVFKLSPTAIGYTESILHSFGGSDGYFPNAVVLKGTNLVGTTLYGGGSNACGTYGCGVVFKLTTAGLQFSVLHDFANADGANPEGPLLVKGATLYGTTVCGGTHGQGSVFALVP